MKLINWKSYYEDDQIKEYNLNNYKDNDIEIKLFNTNDLNMSCDNQINYLNPYLGELPMMYYIWKNNLKSDYICISQYRRDITYIDYNELDKNKIQVIYRWDDNDSVKLKDRLLPKRDPSGKIKRTLWKFLKEHYNLSNSELLKIKNKTIFQCMACFVWAMNWETYCKLCELIFGFLDSLFPNDKWKNIDTILKFRNKEKIKYIKKYNKDDDYVFNDNRYLVHIIEDILSIILSSFIDIFKNNKYSDETYILTEVNKNHTIFDVADFYRLNIKCNPEHIYIKCLDNKSYKEFDNFFIKRNHWAFYRMIVINKNQKYDNVIQLNINQYINLNQPIDLYNNQYEIKNIK